jgi:hypothetical protein
MLPPHTITGNDSQCERLEGNQKHAVVSHLVSRASFPILYTVLVWYFEHVLLLIFSYTLIKNIRLKNYFVPSTLLPAGEPPLTGVG